MNFDSYLDPDRNIPGWSDEIFEIESTVAMKEGELLKVDNEYFEVVNVLNSIDNWKEYIISNTRKKDNTDVDHFLEKEQIIFID